MTIESHITSLNTTDDAKSSREIIKPCYTPHLLYIDNVTSVYNKAAFNCSLVYQY
jgi:hypothetical protein